MLTGALLREREREPRPAIGPSLSSSAASSRRTSATGYAAAGSAASSRRASLVGEGGDASSAAGGRGKLESPTHRMLISKFKVSGGACLLQLRHSLNPDQPARCA